MDDFGKQRINFVEVLPILYQRIPSVSQTLILWAITIVLLGVQHAVARHWYENLRLDKNTLTTRLNSALEDLSGKAIPGEQGKLVAISNETVGLNDIGFYADLLALASQHSTHVWFTRIMIDKESKEVALEGDASSTQALNHLYLQLIDLPEFSNYGLNLRDIKRVIRTDSQERVLHSFVITNVKKENRRRR